MDASERVNLPAWHGEAGHYEIWFVVVFDTERDRASWVRYTTFSPSEGGAPQCTVWAADFDATRTPPTIWAKANHPISDYHATTDHFSVTIGDATIRQGHCSGNVATSHSNIAWQFDYKMGSVPVRRTPAVLEQVRLATEAVHACSDAPCIGFIEVNGTRYDVTHGTAVQMHLHGTRRLDDLSWVWAPSLIDRPEAPTATVEVVSARSKNGFSLRPFASPRMTSLFFRHQDEVDDLTQFPDAMRPTVTHAGPGILDVAHTSVRRAIRVRSYAPLETFAAWAYRNPSGNDLYVAQSDIASCVVESFERRHPFAPWHPKAIVSTKHRSALELHGVNPIEGLSYVGWNDSEVPALPELVRRETPMAPNGTMQPLPPATTVIGAGTTFRETATDAGIYMFHKGPDALQQPLSGNHANEQRVIVPTQAALRAALTACEPELASVLAERYPYLPLLLDYEVELVMIALAPMTTAELRAGKAPAVGWALGNDLSSRACQFLGEGQANRMQFWSTAKSFPGFLPMSRQMWVPAEPVDMVPPVRLRTWVNGDIRQDTEASQMLVTPSQILTAATELLGRDIAPGDYILCGTPAGLALKVPQWRRRLAGLGNDRFGKLDAAIKMYVDGAGFLRPGDVVEIDAGFVGNDRIRIEIPSDENAP
ncbi:MAG TPA: fumarylacetoacetate hydrolase family protein [Kofleriaceae bacterium]|nr:fumarylacetoacetate hydrolase family protein [Kofleriaceae bacterium]